MKSSTSSEMENAAAPSQDSRKRVALARVKRERQQQEEGARGVVLPEPCRADRDRVGGDHGRCNETHGEGSREEQHCEARGERREEDQQPVVVEGGRQQPPG